MIQALHDDDKINIDIDIQSRRKYDIEDIIVFHDVPNVSGKSHKLDLVFKGPYIVMKVLNNDRYLIEDLSDSKHMQRCNCNTCSVDYMKPWCTLSPQLDGDDESSLQEEMSGEAEQS